MKKYIIIHNGEVNDDEVLDESLCGDWVRYEDVRELERELAEARAELEKAYRAEAERAAELLGTRAELEESKRINRAWILDWESIAEAAGQPPDIMPTALYGRVMNMRTELEKVRGREQGTLAQRIHSAYTAYGQLEWDLFEAIEKIVGENNVEDTHVECDSVYDSSVEIVMADGKELTKEHREKILALGFARIWCDGKYRRAETTAAAKSLAARLSRLEAVAPQAISDAVDQAFSDGMQFQAKPKELDRGWAQSMKSKTVKVALAAALGDKGAGIAGYFWSKDKSPK